MTSSYMTVLVGPRELKAYCRVFSEIRISNEYDYRESKGTVQAQL